jgi:hypothetical protein
MTQVTESDRTAQAQPALAHRYDRESAEFGRVLNLSDAVFVIALTLERGHCPWGVRQPEGSKVSNPRDHRQDSA